MLVMTWIPYLYSLVFEEIPFVQSDGSYSAGFKICKRVV